MKRFRLHFRPMSVADLIQTERPLDYERDPQRSPAHKAAREQLRRWRQLKHHLA